MLSIFRKWSIQLRKRRLQKERAVLRSYKIREEDAKGHAQRCHNCKAPLSGPFCHVCGQRDDDLKRPIWTFFRELMDALFDTDSKFIKTFFLLLLVPGGLSRAFNMGRRARFLPPLRLYVVLSFAFFITLSLTDILILDVKVTPKEQVTAAREVLEQRREFEDEMKALRDELKAEADRLRDAGIDPGNMGELNIPTPTPPVIPDIEIPTNIEGLEGLEELEDLLEDTGQSAEVVNVFGQLMKSRMGDGGAEIAKAQEQIRDLLNDPDKNMSETERQALQKVLQIDVDKLKAAEEKAKAITSDDEGLPYDFDVAMFVPNDRVERQGIDQRDIDHILDNDETPQLVKTATVNFMEALKDPAEFNDLFNDSIPWAMVILVPVFALILKITHWGKGRYYLNQLVFALHFHSFLFVLLTAFAFIVPSLDGEEAIEAFWLITSGYLIIALKVGQEQSWIRAFLKAGFIYVSYFVIMFATLGGVLFLTLGDYSFAQLFSGELPGQ